MAIFGQTPIKANKPRKSNLAVAFAFSSMQIPLTFCGLNREIMSKKEIVQPAANFADQKRQKQTFVTSLLKKNEQ